MRLSKLFQLIIFLIFTSVFTGCSVSKVMDQPDRKDLSVLTMGNERLAVLAELGTPKHTEKKSNGHTLDLYVFEQGQHGAVKGIKAAVYGIYAVGTLGISELFTWPAEGMLGKSDMQIAVTFDNDEKIVEVRALKDDRWIGFDVESYVNPTN